MIADKRRRAERWRQAHRYPASLLSGSRRPNGAEVAMASGFFDDFGWCRLELVLVGWIGFPGGLGRFPPKGRSAGWLRPTHFRVSFRAKNFKNSRRVHGL